MGARLQRQSNVQICGYRKALYERKSGRNDLAKTTCIRRRSRNQAMIAVDGITLR